MSEILFYPLKIRGGKQNKIKTTIEEQVKKKKLQSLLTDIRFMPYGKASAKKNKGDKEIKQKYLSYIYIQGDCTNPKLREIIAQTEDVLGWIGVEGWGLNQEPYPISAKEIDKMTNRVTQKQNISKTEKEYKKGDRITVKDSESPFRGYTGEIVEASQNNKPLKISLSLFGGQQQASVTLTPDQVEKIPHKE